jgi:DNA polymerase I-like protein with 3'-5' exonuclease and polymerase domains
MNSLCLTQEQVFGLCEGKQLDIHRAYAARYFKVDYDAVTPEQRRWAKNDLFLTMYGGDVTKFKVIEHG